MMKISGYQTFESNTPIKTIDLELYKFTHDIVTVRSLIIVYSCVLYYKLLTLQSVCLLKCRDNRIATLMTALLNFMSVEGQGKHNIIIKLQYSCIVHVHALHSYTVVASQQGRSQNFGLGFLTIMLA